MKFYNTMDSVFGGRLSQLIIVMATALVGLFTAIGGGLILLSSSFRMIETITLAMEGLNFALSGSIANRGLLNTLLVMSVGEEKALQIATDGNVEASKNIIARRLGILVKEGEIVSTRVLILGILDEIKVKLMDVVATGKNTASRIISVFTKVRSKEATLSEAISEEIHTASKKSNTVAIISNTFAKFRSIIVTWSEVSANEGESISSWQVVVATLGKVKSKLLDIGTTIRLTASTIWHTVVEWLTTESTFAEALSHNVNAMSKIADASATYGLASATIFLESTLAPLLIPLLLIVGAIIAIIVVIEKLGEAFGWWSDFGSMIDAISSGINRLWNAFMGSDIVQGIIQYFGDFIATIQDVFQSISDMFALLFGWEDDGGTFDIVQSIINAFGTLGNIISWVWNLMDDWSNSPLGIITWLNPLGILIFHLDEIGSLFEDIRDAIDLFTQTDEFQALSDAFGEVWTALQEPFQEIWSLINEIMGLFGEMFQDPEGQGTEERINFFVEILKGLATIIRVVVIPAIRGIAIVIRVILTPIRAVLTVIRAIIGAIQWATSVVDIFGIAWQVITTPLRIVQNVLQGIGKMINTVSDAIKNSIIGKLLGWDKDDKGNSEGGQVDSARNNLYGRMKNRVNSSDMDIVSKHQILGELDKQNLTSNNVNNVRNLGRTYNNHNNQRQVVINQNFSEGSMPIDARNMTKKEARKMFIGAFGYNRSVGSKGILR